MNEWLILIGVIVLVILGYTVWGYCVWKWVEYMHRQLHKSERKVHTRNS